MTALALRRYILIDILKDEFNFVFSLITISLYQATSVIPNSNFIKIEFIKIHKIVYNH